MNGISPKRRDSLRLRAAPPGRQWRLAAAVAALSCALAPARGGPQPASGPADSVPAAPVRELLDQLAPPETVPIRPAGTVAEALDFDDDEKKILQDVTDGDTELNAAALYVLLRRAEMLPDERQSHDEAEQPNPKSFWTEPGRYRARLVRVEGLVYGQPTDWSKEVKPSPRWGNRGVHVIYLKVADMPDPVLVFLTRKPPEDLPRRLRVAGLFYKLVRLAENPQTGDPSKQHLYPVMVAKTIFRSHSPGGLTAAAGILFGLVILLLVAFMMLRRYVSRRRGESESGYRSLRAPAGAPGPPGTEPEANEEVDELLRREVEAYRAEREADTENETADHKNDSR